MTSPAKEDVAGLILTGGRSSRMGRDKATLTIGRRTLWQIAVDTLQSLVGRIVFVGAVAGFQPPKPYSLIADDPAGFGPLGGLATGLEQSGCDHHLVVAVDYPLLQPALLKSLLGHSTDAQAVCGSSDVFLEPLVAYYHVDCASAARRMIADGELRTHRLFERVPSRVLTSDEYDRVDPKRLSQINVNTPDDLKRVEDMMNSR